MTAFSDIESLMEGWDTVFQGGSRASMTTETFPNLCPLLWVEFGPVEGCENPTREILFSVLPSDVEEDFFRTFQTVDDAERSRRCVAVSHPDWTVVVATIPGGYPLRLVGGVINTSVLEQDSTIPAEIKNFALSPNVPDHDVLCAGFPCQAIQHCRRQAWL